MQNPEALCPALRDGIVYPGLEFGHLLLNAPSDAKGVSSYQPSCKRIFTWAEWPL